MAKKEALLIEATPDLCAALSWGLYPVQKYLETRRPMNNEEASDCRDGVEPILDLMDQVGCRYLPKLRTKMLGLCKVKK